MTHKTTQQLTNEASAERIALALAACDGMSDAELARRGKGGFVAMRDRKRSYALIARRQASIVKMVTGELIKARKEIVDMQEAQQDMPVNDVSQAQALIAAIATKNGGAAA